MLGLSMKQKQPLETEDYIEQKLQRIEAKVNTLKMLCTSILEELGKNETMEIENKNVKGITKGVTKDKTGKATSFVNRILQG